MQYKLPFLRHIFAIENRTTMNTNPNFNDVPAKQERTTSVFIHLSAFSKIFFPFAGVIVPLIIWSSNRENEFANEQGRQAINFQLSLILYKFILVLIAIPVLIYFIADIARVSDSIEIDGLFELISLSFSSVGLVVVFLFLSILTILDIIFIIIAAVKASNGELFRYPLSISFIKKTK